MEKNTVIEVNNLSMRFNLAVEKTDTIKEYIVKLLKGQLMFNEFYALKNINLEIIAGELYVSVNQLCRIFKKNLGTTVTKYIAGKRISEAKKLLKNGHSVSDTAILCGYHDYANFIRCFKKSVGVSPGKYAMHN